MELAALLAMGIVEPLLCTKRMTGKLQMGNTPRIPSHDPNPSHISRHAVVGVFSRCMLINSNQQISHANAKIGCCDDPVVYQKINEEIKNWIWKTAPGVRDTNGCPKKENKSKIDIKCFLFFDAFHCHPISRTNSKGSPCCSYEGLQMWC